MEPIPVFVDCDNTMGLPGAEIDDGLTILYLLDQPAVRLVGVSATHGNADVDTVMRQTRALVDALGLDLAVARGARPADPDSPGPNAPGGPAASTAPPAPAATPGRAADEPGAAGALVAASREHPGRLVVLGLGALTNIAAASALDPGFFGRLAGILVMGGYLGPLRFPRREVAELNFSADPVAAHTVLNAPCPVTVMSAQLCLAARFGPAHLLMHNRGPRWLRRTVRGWYRAFSGATGARGFYLWDLVPAVAVCEPHRIPPRLVRLASSRADLDTGRLRLERLEGTRATGATGRDDAQFAREPGVVSVPDRILRRRRFAADCAASWARSARARAPRGGMLRGANTV